MKCKVVKHQSIVREYNDVKQTNTITTKNNNGSWLRLRKVQDISFQKSNENKDGEEPTSLHQN